MMKCTQPTRALQCSIPSLKISILIKLTLAPSKEQTATLINILNKTIPTKNTETEFAKTIFNMFIKSSW